MSDTQTSTEKPLPIEQLNDGTAIVTVEGKDRRIGRDADDDDTADDTSGQGATETGRSRAARRRDRARAAREDREGTIAQLSTMVSGQQTMILALARGQQQSALATIEGEANQARAAHAEAQRRLAEAIEKGDGNAAAEAQQVIANATSYYNQCVAQHRTVTENLKRMPAPQEGDDQGGNREGGRVDVPARSATADRLRDEFLDEHPWIDPKSDDVRQRLVRTIDASVRQDGFNPASKDYWDELRERLREEMPHAFEDGGKSVRRSSNGNGNGSRRGGDPDYEYADDEPPPRRRGGPPLGGSGRDGGDGARPGQVRLTPDMVKGLEEAGIPLVGGTPEQIKRRNNITRAWHASKPR